MPQGKLKQKVKVPNKIKQKQKKSSSAFTKRHNAPVKAKQKVTEAHKIKQAVSKMVNQSAEEEIRIASTGGQAKLSKAQNAVAKHTQKNPPS